MYRGTTPTIRLTITGLKDIAVHKLYLTIKQFGSVIEKTIDDVTISDDVIACTLSQRETLSLKNDKAKIQVRLLSKSGVAYATNVIELPVKTILKDGEI